MTSTIALVIASGLAKACDDGLPPAMLQGHCICVRGPR